MAKPTTSVYLAFTKTIDGNWDYVNVTSYVRSVTIDRGKSNELDVYSSGSCGIVFDNRLRVFDPEFTGSPYYGLIDVGIRVKVNTSSYTSFIGSVDSWSFAYDEKSFDATASLSATDAVSDLAKINLVNDVTLPRQTTGNRLLGVLYAPDVSWREATCFRGGNRYMMADTVPSDTNLMDYASQVVLNDGASLFARRDGWLATQDNTWTNAAGLAFIRTNYCVNPSFSSVTMTNWDMGVRTTGWAYVGQTSITTATTSGTGYSVGYLETDAAKYLTDTPYNISFYIKAGTTPVTIQFYAGMTQAAVMNMDSAAYQTITLAANEIRRINLGAVRTYSACNGITFGANIADRTPRNNAFYIDCVLVEKGTAMAQWFDGVQDFVSGLNLSITSSWAGTPYLSNSILSITAAQLQDFTTKLLLSDTDPTGIKFNDLSVTFGAENLYNAVDVVGYSDGQAFDSSTTDKYGVRTYVVDSILDSDVEATSLAKFLLGKYRTADYRAETVSIVLNGLSTTQQNQLLALDLFGAIRLQFKPGNYGNLVDKSYLVVGISHSVDVEQHTMVLKLLCGFGKEFILDSSVYGVLDQNRLR